MEHSFDVIDSCEIDVGGPADDAVSPGAVRGADHVHGNRELAGVGMVAGDVIEAHPPLGKGQGAAADTSP